MRNRISHRGTFILRYPALDEFVASYLLPFVIKLVRLRAYSAQEATWKYQRLSCGIDPIQEIIATLKGQQFDLRKVAILKELGRAAYANPLFVDSVSDALNNLHLIRARAVTRVELEEEVEASRILPCPVCGVTSLVVYSQILTDDIEDPEWLWDYEHQVTCMCCTFEINNGLGSGKTHGLPLGDFWAEEVDESRSNI